MAIDLAVKSGILQAAWKLLQQGDDENALESLVQCWREWPAPELADVIGLFVSRMTARLPPVTGVARGSTQEAWLTLAAHHRTAAVGRLFEALPATTGGRAIERIGALKAWPATPALSAAIARWLESPPFEGKNRPRCFLPALEVLEVQRDVRVIPLLKRLTQPDNRSRAIGQFGLRSWKPLCVLTRSALAWPVPRDPSAVEREILQRFRERLSAPKGPEPVGVKIDDLYAAVYENPDDDTPRLMLADVLQERGDARGEFIALQVARAATGARPSRRENELLGIWGREWLGGLEPVLLKGDLKFVRGFLAECSYDGLSPPGDLADAPEWATVTHLDVTHAGQYASGAWELMLSPRFKSLRHLRGASDADLTAIADSRQPLSWESIDFSLFGVKGSSWDLLSRSMPLPVLTALGLRSVHRAPLRELTLARVESLLAGPLGQTLQRLSVAMEAAAFGALIELAMRRGLTSIALHPRSQAFGLRFDVAPRAVVIHLEPVSDSNVALAAAALRSVAPGALDRALLTLPGRAAVEGDAVVHGKRRATLKPLRDALGPIDLLLPG